MRKDKVEFLDNLYGFYCDHLFNNDINTNGYIADKEGGIKYLQNLLETRPEKVWDYLSFRSEEGGFTANELKKSMCKLFNNTDLFNYAQDNRIASFQFKIEIEDFQKNIGLDNTKIKSFFDERENDIFIDTSFVHTFTKAERNIFTDILEKFNVLKSAVRNTIEALSDNKFVEYALSVWNMEKAKNSECFNELNKSFSLENNVFSFKEFKMNDAVSLKDKYKNDISNAAENSGFVKVKENSYSRGM